MAREHCDHKKTTTTYVKSGDVIHCTETCDFCGKIIATWNEYT